MADLPYRQLVAWQKADAIAHEVLDLADESPAFGKRFYFRDQICAAALSIPANLAEGNGRSTPLDYASFVDRSRGSLFELDYWLLVAVRRGWLKDATHADIARRLGELNAMLTALAKSLRRMPALPSRDS